MSSDPSSSGAPDGNRAGLQQTNGNGGDGAGSRSNNGNGSGSANPGSGGGIFSLLLSALGRNPSNLRETLEDALTSGEADAGAFSDEEREMLKRLLRYGGLRVEDVMVPRADIIAADVEETVADVLRIFVEAGVSRIPLYRETLDDPRGVLHIKDLLACLVEEAEAATIAGRDAGLAGEAAPRDGEPLGNAPSSAEAAAAVLATGVIEQGVREPDTAMSQPPAGASLSAARVEVPKRDRNDAVDDEVGKRILAEKGRRLDLGSLDLSRQISALKARRDVLYVPPSMPAMSLMIRMQTSRTHMALVVDEYGGTDGLVTIEDLVEEIVGDIEDEHDDEDETYIVETAVAGLVASARTPIENLEAHLGVKLIDEDDEDDIDTIGGLVFSLVGRVPARGEIIPHPVGIEFEILDADPRRIKRIKIHKRTPRLPFGDEKA